MGINSISAGDVNKDGCTDLVIANGGAVLSNPASGKDSSDDPDVNTGGITVLLNQVTADADDGGADNYFAVDDHVWADGQRNCAGDGERWQPADGNDHLLRRHGEYLHDSGGAVGELSGECGTRICSGDACADGGLFGRCDASGFDFGAGNSDCAACDDDEGADGDDADLECGPGDEWTERDLYGECGGVGQVRLQRRRGW